MVSKNRLYEMIKEMSNDHNYNIRFNADFTHRRFDEHDSNFCKLNSAMVEQQVAINDLKRQIETLKQDVSDSSLHKDIINKVVIDLGYAVTKYGEVYSNSDRRVVGAIAQGDECWTVYKLKNYPSQMAKSSKSKTKKRKK